MTNISFRQSLRIELHSDCALASASWIWAGNLYLNWLVYVVKSIFVCLNSAIMACLVPSLPPNWLFCRMSRWFLQHMMDHINRLGTLWATGWGREENLVAQLRITEGSPRAASGRMSRLFISYTHISMKMLVAVYRRTYIKRISPSAVLDHVLGLIHCL